MLRRFTRRNRLRLRHSSSYHQKKSVSHELAAFPLDSSHPLSYFNYIRPLLSSRTFVDRITKPDLSPQDAEIFTREGHLLKRSLSEKHIEGICEHWSLLQKHNLSRFLGLSDMYAYSDRLADIWTEEHRWIEKSARWYDERAQRILEDMTLAAAVGGTTKALSSLFLLQLRWGNTQAVTMLYDRFLDLEEMSQAPKKNELGDHQHRKTKDDTLASIIPETTYDEAVVHLLVCAIIAHAIRDSFEDALRTVVRNPIRWTSYNVGEVLKHLQLDPDIRLKVEVYAKRLDLARSTCRPGSLAKRIASLANDSLAPLTDFYTSMVEAIDGPAACIAANPESFSRERPVVMPHVAWAAFIAAFSKHRRPDLLERLRNDLDRLRVPITSSLWTNILNGYERMGAADELLAAWQSMTAQVQPEALAYRPVILMFLKNERTYQATKWIDKLKVARKTFAFPDAQVVMVYNSVLHHLLRRAKISEALALLRSMDQSGIKPDLVTFNGFLAYYGKRGEFKAIATTLRAIRLSGLVGDVVTWSTLLMALFRTGHSDAIPIVLNVMRKNGVVPNVVTYTGIIDELMRDGNANQVNDALKLLAYMENSESVKPNLITYTTVLAPIYRGQWDGQDSVEEFRLDVLSRMRRSRISLDTVGYNTLLQASMENKTYMGLKRARELYKEMVELRVPMGKSTWYILLTGLIERGEWVMAKEVVRNIKVEALQPGTSLWLKVQAVKARERH